MFFPEFPGPYRRALKAYTAVLIAFALLFFVGLFAAIVAAENKLVPTEGIGIVVLALSVSIYLAAGRTAKWAADRVLRNAGVKP